MTWTCLKNVSYLSLYLLQNIASFTKPAHISWKFQIYIQAFEPEIVSGSPFCIVTSVSLPFPDISGLRHLCAEQYTSWCCAGKRKCWATGQWEELVFFICCTNQCNHYGVNVQFCWDSIVCLTEANYLYSWPIWRGITKSCLIWCDSQVTTCALTVGLLVSTLTQIHHLSVLIWDNINSVGLISNNTYKTLWKIKYSSQVTFYNKPLWGEVVSAVCSVVWPQCSACRHHWQKKICLSLRVKEREEMKKFSQIHWVIYQQIVIRLKHKQTKETALVSLT